MKCIQGDLLSHEQTQDDGMSLESARNYKNGGILPRKEDDSRGSHHNTKRDITQLATSLIIASICSMQRDCSNWRV